MGDVDDVGLALTVLLVGLAIAFLVFVISGGHVVFLPLILLFPFGFFFGRRRVWGVIRPGRTSHQAS